MASTGDAGRVRLVVGLALLALLPLLAAFRPAAAPVDDPYLWFAHEDFVDKFDARFVDGIPQAVYKYKGAISFRPVESVRALPGGQAVRLAPALFVRLRGRSGRGTVTGWNRESTGIAY